MTFICGQAIPNKSHSLQARRSTSLPDDGLADGIRIIRSKHFIQMIALCFHQGRKNLRYPFAMPRGDDQPFRRHDVERPMDLITMVSAAFSIHCLLIHLVKRCHPKHATRTSLSSQSTMSRRHQMKLSLPLKNLLKRFSLGSQVDAFFVHAEALRSQPPSLAVIVN